MKKQYETIDITLYVLSCGDVIRTSQQGEVDGDETLYPTPDGWGNNG
jgi:hypothetical protein